MTNSSSYLIDLSCRYIVVTGQFDIQKTLIVSKVQVHLQEKEKEKEKEESPISQNKKIHRTR